MNDKLFFYFLKLLQLYFRPALLAVSFDSGVYKLNVFQMNILSQVQHEKFGSTDQKSHYKMNRLNDQGSDLLLQTRRELLV